MGLKIRIYEKDLSLLKLLTIILEQKGHQVQGFTGTYRCPARRDDSCICPPRQACVDAVIINSMQPFLDTLHSLADQEQKGCKLAKQKIAIMSSFFTEKQKQTIQDLGHTTIKIPFRLSKIDDWLESCETRNR